MSRVPDNKEEEPPHLPKRKKRHSSLLDIFVSHQQVTKIIMEERARKRAEADEKAEKEKAIAAAVAAIEPVPTAPEVAASQPIAAQPVAAQPIATQPIAAQPIAAQPTAPEAAAPQPVATQPVAPEAPKPEEAAHPAGPEVIATGAVKKAPWLPADDVAILRLKAQNKTWNEIADVLVGRSKNDLRLRYKEIGPKEATGGPASAGGNAVKDGQANNGKQKGPGGKKGKGKQASTVEEQQGEASNSASGPAPGPAPVNQPRYTPAPFFRKPPGPAPVYKQPPTPAPVDQNQPAAAPAGPFVWPGPPTVPLVNHNEAVVVNQRDLRVKGLLKRGGNGTIQFNNVAVPPGATTWNGTPIIYQDDYDPLDMNDLSYLYNTKCTFEERKWTILASKLFDKTGKRIEPEYIKEKLQNCYVAAVKFWKLDHPNIPGSYNQTMDRDSSHMEGVIHSLPVVSSASDRYDIPQWMVEILCGEDDEAEVPYSVTAANLLANTRTSQSDSDMTPSMVKMICGKSSGEEKLDSLTRATATVNEQRVSVPQVLSLEAMSKSNTEAIPAITPSVEERKTLDSSTENNEAFGSDKQARHGINEAAATVHDNLGSEETIPHWMVEMLCGSDQDNDDEGPDSSTNRERSAANPSLHEYDGLSEDKSNTDTVMVKFGKKPRRKSLFPTSRGGHSRARKTTPKTERVQNAAKFSSWTKNSTHAFVKEWMAKKMPAEWTDEKREEEFLIQGRRAGISHQQLYNSQYLKHIKYRSVGAITYQLRELNSKGVDVRPRTEEFHRRSISCLRSNPHSEESELIIKMRREGKSVATIHESGIVKYGKNTPYAIKQRIKAMRDRGIDLSPRSEDAV
ncbi:MAG: hypothetical protein Q9212_006080 [Teloschistes hypoglaucus]